MMIRLFFLAAAFPDSVAVGSSKGTKGGKGGKGHKGGKGGKGGNRDLPTPDPSKSETTSILSYELEAIQARVNANFEKLQTTVTSEINDARNVQQKDIADFEVSIRRKISLTIASPPKSDVEQFKEAPADHWCIAGEMGSKKYTLTPIEGPWRLCVIAKGDKQVRVKEDALLLSDGQKFHDRVEQMFIAQAYCSKPRVVESFTILLPEGTATESCIFKKGKDAEIEVPLTDIPFSNRKLDQPALFELLEAEAAKHADTARKLCAVEKETPLAANAAEKIYVVPPPEDAIDLKSNCFFAMGRNGHEATPVPFAEVHLVPNESKQGGLWFNIGETAKILEARAAQEAAARKLCAVEEDRLLFESIHLVPRKDSEGLTQRECFFESRPRYGRIENFRLPFAEVPLTPDKAEFDFDKLGDAIIDRI